MIPDIAPLGLSKHGMPLTTTMHNKQPLILIVDDEMDMRLFMSTLFKTNGFTTVAVRDGRQGLTKAAELKPDLILLDVMMPAEGGAKMFKGLKEDPGLCDIPVIILSAVDEKAYRHYLHMLNTQTGHPIPPPDAYVAKPPDPEALLSLVQKILSCASPP